MSHARSFMARCAKRYGWKQIKLREDSYVELPGQIYWREHSTGTLSRLHHDEWGIYVMLRTNNTEGLISAHSDLVRKVAAREAERTIDKLAEDIDGVDEATDADVTDG